MSDPLQTARKRLLQSPRLPLPLTTPVPTPSTSTIPSTTNINIVIPKLYTLGTNHPSNNTTNNTTHRHNRQPGFDKINGILVDRANQNASKSNSPRPVISPRALGQLPMTLTMGVGNNGGGLGNGKKGRDDAGVLRFFCYFEELDDSSESEPETPSLSSVGAKRIRKVTILLYLTDGTLEITEPRVPNSGIAGGCFLNRTHVPAPNANNIFSEDRPIDASDFTVGGDVVIFGRVFRVFDADDFTRRHIPGLAEAVVCPVMPTRPGVGVSSSGVGGSGKGVRVTPRARKWVKINSTSITNTTDTTTSASTEPPLETLCFYAKWTNNADNPDNRGGASERKELYKINYHLIDGSVEILISNKHALNYEVHPTLLSRQKATRNPEVTVYDIGNTDRLYITEEDLVVGQTVVIQTREMLIYGATELTFQWLVDYKGIDMKGDVIDVGSSDRDDVLYKNRGFNEDDYYDENNPLLVKKSIAPVLTSKQKFYKQAHLAGKILRFGARVPDDLKEKGDVEQVFVISYFLADDTVGVFCRSPPNSGLSSGHFLSRGYHVNVLTKKAFTPSAFTLNARIHFRSKVLVITDVDDYSLAYTHLTLNEIMGLIRKKVEERGIALHHTFKKYDTDKNGLLSYDEFAAVLRGGNLNLDDLITERDMMTLFRHFDLDGGGMISYHEFLTTIEDGGSYHYGGDSKGVDVSERFKAIDMNADEISEYVAKISRRQLEGQREKSLESAMQKFVFYSHSHRGGYGEMHRIFKDFDTDLNGEISLSEFTDIMVDKVHLSKRDAEMLTLKFFPDNCKMIRYNNFLAAIQVYTDAKKKGMFLGVGYEPPVLKGKLEVNRVEEGEDEERKERKSRDTEHRGRFMGGMM